MEKEEQGGEKRAGENKKKIRVTEHEKIFLFFLNIRDILLCDSSQW